MTKARGWRLPNGLNKGLGMPEVYINRPEGKVLFLSITEKGGIVPPRREE
jgi:hypothetical protein